LAISLDESSKHCVSAAWPHRMSEDVEGDGRWPQTTMLPEERGDLRCKRKMPSHMSANRVECGPIPARACRGQPHDKPVRVVFLCLKPWKLITDNFDPKSLTSRRTQLHRAKSVQTTPRLSGGPALRKPPNSTKPSRVQQALSVTKWATSTPIAGYAGTLTQLCRNSGAKSAPLCHTMV
jgi:hypothetical protein